MIENFAIVRGKAESENPDLNHTGSFVSLVSLLILKFARGPGCKLRRTSELGH